MVTKICKKCGIEKPLEEYGVHKSKRHKCGCVVESRCKECENRRATTRYHGVLKLDPEYKVSRKAYKRGHYLANAQMILGKQTIYREIHHMEKLAHDKRWRDNNKSHISQHRKDRKKSDPAHKLVCNLRIRLNKVLKGGHKAGSTIGDLGCSPDECRLYLENKFQPGWDWGNHGKVWQIDHIVPLCSFDLSDREQFLRACHYTNLQPISIENHIKKTTGEIKELRRRGS